MDTVYFYIFDELRSGRKRCVDVKWHNDIVMIIVKECVRQE